jgi:hypothetical protein
MTKIIKIKPKIINNCTQCPYYYSEVQGILSWKRTCNFCTSIHMSVNEARNNGQKSFLPFRRNWKETYLLLNDSGDIPEWCPLEEFVDKQ